MHLSIGKKYFTRCYKALLAFLLLTSLNIRSSKAQTYTKNKYGLQIIDNLCTYQKSVQKDSTQKLVLLTGYIPHIKTNFVYATSQNFTHSILYSSPKPYLRLPVAKALKAVAIALQKRGLGILLFDAYRPYQVTVKMWQVVPDSRYAANPKYGSGHNRGLSVDLSLYTLADGKPLHMPTQFDNFTAKAHQGYQQLPKAILHNRGLLKKLMLQHGFTPLSTEWWHFSFPNTKRKYKIIDLSFNALHNFMTKEAK